MTPAERAAVDQVIALTADGLAEFGVARNERAALKGALAIVEVLVATFEGGPKLDRDLVILGTRLALEEMLGGSPWKSR